MCFRARRAVSTGNGTVLSARAESQGISMRAFMPPSNNECVICCAILQELKYLTKKPGHEAQSAKGGQKHPRRDSDDVEESVRGRRSDRDQLAAMELALSNAAAREKNQQTETWRTLRNKFVDETPAHKLAAAFFSKMAGKKAGEALIGRKAGEALIGRRFSNVVNDEAFKGVLPLAGPAIRLPAIAAAKARQSQKDADLSKPRPSKSMAARVVFPSLVNPGAADDHAPSACSLVRLLGHDCASRWAFPARNTACLRFSLCTSSTLEYSSR